jgi:predicted amidohydrolase
MVMNKKVDFSQTKDVKVAAVGMDVDLHPDDKDNTTRVLEYIDQLADQGVDLIAFPEGTGDGIAPGEKGRVDYNNSLRGSADEPTARHLVEFSEYVPDGPMCQAVAKKAQERGVYVIWSMGRRSDVDPCIYYNTAVLVGPEGYIGKYDKVHLPAGEQLINSNGQGWPVFDTKIGRIGMAICYDSFFEEIYRIYGIKGVDILVLPTGVPRDFQDSNYETDGTYRFFKSMLISEAMSNGLTIVAANAGNPGALNHSMVVNARGEVLAEVPEGEKEGVAIANVGWPALENKKHQVTNTWGLYTFKDRHPEMYGELTKLQEGHYFCNPAMKEEMNSFCGEE